MNNESRFPHSPTRGRRVGCGSNESPQKAIVIVLLVVLVTSFLVSVTVVLLRPIQLDNLLLQRSSSVLGLTGLVDPESPASESEILILYKSLDTRVVDLGAAAFAPQINLNKFDQRKAVNDPKLGEAIAPEHDTARLGRRSRYVRVYLVWKDGNFDRIILPMHGKGMWSTLYGYIALESDLNTVAAATFYEHNETPGLGDQVSRLDWLAKWRGKRLYDERGVLRFEVAGSKVDPGSTTALYHVDALTGATVTADAVSDLVRYWFGPNGYKSFLDFLRKQPPAEPTEEGAR